MNLCPICEEEKPKDSLKYCSYKCRNIQINRNKKEKGIYQEQNKKSHTTQRKNIFEHDGEFKDFKVNCLKCFKKFITNEQENLFPKRKKYFCSRNCANSRVHSEKTKINIRNGVLNSPKITRKEKKLKKLKIIPNPEIYKDYRELCTFRFSLNDYPTKFNFKLIEEFGWYSPKNGKNNPTGICRDHIFSVKDGFKQNIDPYFISHPANCQLLRGNLNQSKHSKSWITKEELFERVEKWNKKLFL
jgi:endogenous inhibitor of DNA gyrase (YacG/DUF329 family)